MQALGFIYRHPEVIFNLALFSLASAVGQVSCKILCVTHTLYLLPL